jgi:hypothetical protein
MLLLLLLAEDEELTTPLLEIPNCVLYWYCPVASTMSWIP